ncbi:MAG: 50S ribosomal protein L1 [Chloroflexi bacterium]|nr:50S ribosomal protein L1 [Chloroflexota bacterium]
MAHRGKRYLEATKVVEPGKQYPPDEAVALVKKMATAKFDETVELHMRINVDPRRSDQQVRGTAIMPAGLGKQVRVLVFAQGEAAKIAEDAGADHVGADDIAKKIEEGWLEFDMALATSDMMPKVSRLGRILGRKGLMPNPKSGTIVQPQDLPQAIKEARLGRLEFRVDRTSIMHVPIGKASFAEAKLLENLSALLTAVVENKPAGVKGQFVRSAYLTTTMAPGIPLDLNATLALAKAAA